MAIGRSHSIEVVPAAPFKDLAAKQGEYNALLATSNSDPKRASELNREIAVLHDQLSAQARSLNLPPANVGYYGRNGWIRMCW